LFRETVKKKKKKKKKENRENKMKRKEKKRKENRFTKKKKKILTPSFPYYFQPIVGSFSLAHRWPHLSFGI
jgi:hypothetical protein